MDEIKLMQAEQDSVGSLLGKIEGMKTLPDGFIVGDLLKMVHIVNTYYGNVQNAKDAALAANGAEDGSKA